MNDHNRQAPYIDFALLIRQLDATRLVPEWLPDGKRQGNEWVTRNPTRQDKQAGSFSVNLNSGKWSDFATGDAGGDLLSLWAYMYHGKDQKAAAHDLARRYNIDARADSQASRKRFSQSQATSSHAAPAPQPAPVQPERDEWLMVMPLPREIKKPSELKHKRLGKPSRFWSYRDAEGRLLFYICRFDPPGERKQILPYGYWTNRQMEGQWRWKGISGKRKRPLYGLDRLARNPDSPVVVCEGEKAAEACQLLLPRFVAVSWMNGAGNEAKADWSPLEGRRVTIWPDNDDSGRKAANAVASQLKGVASAISLVSLPRTLPEKWDAADANAEQARQLVERARPMEELPRGFSLRGSGLWYCDPDDDQQREHWVCAPLNVTARTRDQRNENHGYLLEFQDMDHHPHQWAMPAEMLAGDGSDYRRVLLNKGLAIAPGSKARQLLTQYVQTCRPHGRGRCVSQTGWYDGVYVLPDDVIGHSTERVLLQTTSGDYSGYDCTGTLEGWQAGVARYCLDNSRLVLAVSAAFAAPLLSLIHIEGGGVHLRGSSSTGKTTALVVASSVWGSPDRIRRWRATSNGLEGVARAHNDSLLCMDELAELAAREAGHVAYMLANGSGKSRADKNGEQRQVARWRLLFLSTGEISLADHIREGGGRSRAGHEVRIIDLPADAGAGYGLFEELHGQTDGAHLSRLLVEQSKQFNGQPARAFLAQLAAHKEEAIRLVDDTRQHFLTLVAPAAADGQVKRVADRFALIAAGGELASGWKITGWPQGAATDAAETCFQSWLDNRGTSGSLEDKQALEQVRGFFQMHGRARFGDDQSTEESVRDRAGFIKQDQGERTFLVFPQVFRDEICLGLDYTQVARLLAERDYLVMDGRHYQRKVSLQNGSRPRLYVIRGSILDED
ncbi:MAG: DUF927 domain-containing protein [Marinobacterium sp.]|nr:DUF927 domain-containing protein [Marinobacterium sp.]